MSSLPYADTGPLWQRDCFILPSFSPTSAGRFILPVTRPTYRFVLPFLMPTPDRKLQASLSGPFLEGRLLQTAAWSLRTGCKSRMSFCMPAFYMTSDRRDGESFSSSLPHADTGPLTDISCPLHTVRLDRSDRGIVVILPFSRRHRDREIVLSIFSLCLSLCLSFFLCLSLSPSSPPPP